MLSHTTFGRAIAAVALLLPFAACATDAEQSPDASPPNAADSTTSAELDRVLSKHSLDAMNATEMIDHLDRLGGSERPTDLMASVRPGELVLTAGDDEKSIAIPDDKFYLSIAPYVDQTHDCFHHSLTTCQGELVSETVDVVITDTTNDTVVVDDTRTTFENGFIGIWLPRDIKGTIRIEHDGKVGDVDFATSEDAATCLTTLRMT